MWKRTKADFGQKAMASERSIATKKSTQIILPTGVERFFKNNELIVSKTDGKGNLTYVNEVFLRISGYSEAELLGQPHNVIRHPKMPRCIFKLLWTQLAAGNELFAYVNNLAKNGDNYWVLAHVTPSRDADEKTVGYHSNRRVPSPEILKNTIIPLYQKLLQIEKSEDNRKLGLEKSNQYFTNFIQEQGVGYDEFILSL